MKKLIRAIVALGLEKVTKNWFRGLEASVFQRRILRPLQRYLSYVAVHQTSNVSLPNPSSCIHLSHQPLFGKLHFDHSPLKSVFM